MTCFECEKPIDTMNDAYIIGVDMPYINLTFHKDCMAKVTQFGEEEYLQKNKEKIFELAKGK